MDYNVVSLEISDLITHFAYYNNLVSAALIKNVDLLEEQIKIQNKSKEHLTQFFPDVEFYDQEQQVLPLSKTKDLIITKLKDLKNKDIHNLVEKLEKDAKKIKKLYLALTK